MEVINNIAKQIVEATNNKVVFIGSYSDILRGIDCTAKDIDIIIPQEQLASLETFGKIEEARDNPVFKDKKRFFIRNESIFIDIFVGENAIDSTFETFLLDGIPLITCTIASEIKELKELIRATPPLKFHFKITQRIYKLEKIIKLKN
jgi:hypothetical protein